jgi:hypothetical protein
MSATGNFRLTLPQMAVDTKRFEYVSTFLKASALPHRRNGGSDQSQLRSGC